jgi:hypothetical protein
MIADRGRLTPDTEATTMPEHPPPSALAWLDVLQRIEESLTLSLHRTPELAPTAGPAPAGPTAPLRKLDERLTHWQSCLDEVDGNARAVDRQLAAEEEALKDWLGRAGQGREKLEAWARRRSATTPVAQPAR